MVKIEFVGGISKELAAVMDEYSIPCTCIEGNICEMTEDAYEELHQRARAALDGNDAVVVEHYESELSLAIMTLEGLAQYRAWGQKPQRSDTATPSQKPYVRECSDFLLRYLRAAAL